MKVLVAGGTGLLGSAIVKKLQEAGLDIGILSRSQRSDGGVEWVQGDVTQPEGLDEKLRGWDVVVDAVQFPNYPMENPKKGYTFERIDLGGTKNLVDAAKAAGVQHFVGMSGAGADEHSEYHWSRFKWQEERYIEESGVPYTILKPSWVYGPDDVSLNRFLNFARFLPFVPVIGNGKARIAPVFVEDVAAYVAAVAKHGPSNTIYELGGPEVLTMDEIVKTALRAWGKRRFLFHQPVWLMKIVASVAQYFPGRPLTPDAMDFVTMDGIADNEKARETFGIPLTRLEDALRNYLAR